MVNDLTLQLPVGSLTCVLGLNGSGKTLSLHTLAGLRPTQTGTVSLFGADISALSRRQIAIRLGLLLQVHEDAFPTTVLDAVMMGQYAQLKFWEQESPALRQKASEVIHQLGLRSFEDRLINSLSGGERRRVALATMCLQDPDIWLLDEPTNHLDPQHQMAIMEKLSNLANDGKTILASIHDPLLAARYATHALLLSGNGEWKFGAASDLLTPEQLRNLYGVEYENLQGARFQSLVPA
ncbi:MAG: ABC transporter ATP-binding protein [Gammaproteobacteria bacterium]|nr:ABC transporter ATP-binding protein [Gammaproteobacteria bacterium]